MVALINQAGVDLNQIPVLDNLLLGWNSMHNLIIQADAERSRKTSVVQKFGIQPIDRIISSPILSISLVLTPGLM